MSVSSILAILNSVFFSAYLLQPRKRSLSNILLAFLLLALAFRILKSFSAVVFVDKSSFLLALGLGSMGTIGPLLYFYVKSFLRKIPVRFSLAHFMLPFGMLSVSFAANQLIIYTLYICIVIQIFVYITLSTRLSFKYLFELDYKSKLWLKVLITAVFAIWLTMVIQLIFDNSHTYILTSIVAASLIYTLAFIGFNNGKLFLDKTAIRINPDLHQDISTRFHEILKKEKIYKTPGITISKVASRLEVPTYLISRSINTIDGKSFPELIKEYRLMDIMHNLRDPENHFVSIDALAYEAGFISTSKFYALFKKETGLTPNQFRKQCFQ